MRNLTSLISCNVFAVAGFALRMPLTPTTSLISTAATSTAVTAATMAVAFRPPVQSDDNLMINMLACHQKML